MNIIKEKYGGELRGRTCVDGSGQRKYLKQDETVASPTAGLESLFTTLLIDAYKSEMWEHMTFQERICKPNRLLRRTMNVS